VALLGPSGPRILENRVRGLMDIYPADPAQGSPYGTGDDLFGLPEEVGVGYKRTASLRWCSIYIFFYYLYDLYDLISRRFVVPEPKAGSYPADQ